MKTIDPPACFDVTFFDWLELMGKELLVRFVEQGGLPHSDIEALEQESGGIIPSQIRTYYENCNPWAIWKDPRSVWKTTRDKLAFLLKNDEHILPIDINHAQRLYTVARVLGPETYEIVDIRGDAVINVHTGDLRTYLIGVVKKEAELDDMPPELPLMPL